MPYLLEDGSGYYELEDGSGVYLLEDDVEASAEALTSGGMDPAQFTFRGQKLSNLDDDDAIFAVIEAFLKMH